METTSSASKLAWLAVLVVSIVGCHEATETSGAIADAGDADASAVDSAAPEVFFPSDDTVNNAPEPDTAADTGTPGVGVFGAMCSVPDDCNSGYCIDGPEGPMCSRTCIDSCPDGYACKNVAGSGADPTFICVSIAVRLCQPCRGNADCSLTAGDASGNLCLDSGDAGSFCGLNCGETGWPCPAGYTCETIDGAPAGSGRQCVPADGGECECNGAGIALGLSTDCGVTNEAGRCAGERVCGDEGLTTCDAVVAAVEACDGVDDDCDGQTDEGINGTPCSIENEFGTCQGSTSCDGGNESCEGHSPAPEACNGLDDDCDGATDEEAVGCRDFYIDLDEDGDGAAEVRCLCGADQVLGYTADDDGDCDDNDSTAFPGAEEACDGADDDCDSATDEGDALGCASHYYDGDGDGYGTDEARCLCAPDVASMFSTTAKGDCNDAQLLVHPGALEACNGYDDDCDQITDPKDSSGCTSYAYDGDSDGWGLLGDVQCLCSASGNYTSTRLDPDCDDTNALVNMGGVELCNGKDDDCDSATDESFGDFDEDGLANCVDPDNDNDGDPNESDCKPYDPLVYGWAEDVCDGVDNDCDGTSDLEGSEGCSTFYFDGDVDGFGIANNTSCLCGPSGKYTATKSPDCVDSNPTINPDAPEVCDSVDNDCDLSLDPEGTTGCTTFYHDGDNDGWGLAASSRCLCAAIGQHSATKQPDCNDDNIQINPGESESCDGLDNDCDNDTDEGAGDNDDDDLPDCVDPDDDNDGDPDNNDCAPLDEDIHEDSMELCDGLDNDCNSQTDEEGASGCDTWYYDNDGDSFGVASNSKCLCEATGKYDTQTTGDCNDANGSVHPNAAEVCDNTDNNCDFVTDPANSGGCSTYYLDSDNDTYGHATSSQCLCAPNLVTKYKATNNSDCYDNNASAKPGQTGWFTVHRGDGSFDYNCANGSEPRYQTYGECPFLCGGTNGWWGPIPGCGGQGDWMTDCYIECWTPCCVDVGTQTQSCH